MGREGARFSTPRLRVGDRPYDGAGCPARSSLVPNGCGPCRRRYDKRGPFEVRSLISRRQCRRRGLDMVGIMPVSAKAVGSRTCRMRPPPCASSRTSLAYHWFTLHCSLPQESTEFDVLDVVVPHLAVCRVSAVHDQTRRHGLTGVDAGGSVGLGPPTCRPADRQCYPIASDEAPTRSPGRSARRLKEGHVPAMPSPSTPRRLAAYHPGHGCIGMCPSSLD